MFIEAVAAMDKDGYIGKNQALPWDKIEEEQRLFYELTRNAAVVFGATTARTIGESIDTGNRELVCITRNPVERRKSDKFHNVDHFVANLEDVCRVTSCPRIVIGGGQEVFKNFLQFCDVIHATIVLDEFGGDKRFCQHVSPFVLEQSDRINTLEKNPDLVYNKYTKDPEGDVISLY